ncbi:MAG: class IV adenylate cyclase [Chloroflexota bacterium]
MANQEIEVKFAVRDLGKIEDKLVREGAQMIMPRSHEVNLRFDTTDGKLSKNGQALRLRQDQHITLTYKGPSHEQEGARVRTEIQTRVDDFGAAMSILEALGFQVVLRYEKFRTEYLWRETHVSLDEMPYGIFLEVEGENPNAVREVCDAFGLKWANRIPYSYVEIFTRLQEIYALPSRDLTFDAFHSWQGSLSVLGIYPAD